MEHAIETMKPRLLFCRCNTCLVKGLIGTMRPSSAPNLGMIVGWFTDLPISDPAPASAAPARRSPRLHSQFIPSPQTRSTCDPLGVCARCDGKPNGHQRTPTPSRSCARDRSNESICGPHMRSFVVRGRRVERGRRTWMPRGSMRRHLQYASWCRDYWLHQSASATIDRRGSYSVVRAASNADERSTI